MGGPPTSSQPPNGDGGQGQTYCLRWNNHKSNLVEILDALIKVESYVDCTIVVDDQVQFKAHRVVLAANSPYFGSILHDVPMDHCSIIFPGVKAFEMRALLEYMYTGEVNVTQSQIPKIMRIAEELEVKGLFDMADLKEKFNKLSQEHADRAGNPYASTSLNPAPYASAATSSSSATAAAISASHAPDGKDYHSQPPYASEPQNATQHHHQHHQQHPQHNSSSVISTSSNISPSAAPTSSSSPPYNSYKSPYSNLYTKSPPTSAATTQNPASVPQTPTATLAAAAVAAQQQSSSAAERNQQPWPLSPSAAAAAAMLSSVYESAPDMNPLKRKKLSSISSMLMQRDTPILRNVLAQANPADTSLLLPGSGAAAKGEKSAGAAAEKNSPHTGLVGANAHNNNHSFNGSDYSSDKKYPDEPHSPYTDRSFEDEANFDRKAHFAGNGSSNASNQKPEWKRYKQYTRTDITSAIQCVREGMSALQASRKFHVPSRTLYDKVKKLGITTGRPMNRTLKRSPNNVESSAAFPYAHGYGQSEPLMSSMHEQRSGGGGGGADEREPKDPRDHQHHHHMPPTIPHPAAALLDHAFLQQALENRGGDLAGRDALHAMALAAAAHAAANQQRLTTSPGLNGAAGVAPIQPPTVPARSPSPHAYGLKYARPSEHELLLAAAEREKERRQMMENEMEMEREKRELKMERQRDQREREHRREFADDADDDDDGEEDDHVEDLSVARKDSGSSPAELSRRRPDATYSPPSPHNSLPVQSAPLSLGPSGSSGSGVIMPPISSNHKMLEAGHSSRRRHSSSSSSGGAASGDDDEFISAASMKRELIIDESRAD